MKGSMKETAYKFMTHGHAVVVCKHELKEFLSLMVECDIHWNSGLRADLYTPAIRHSVVGFIISPKSGYLNWGEISYFVEEHYDLYQLEQLKKALFELNVPDITVDSLRDILLNAGV